MRIKTTGHAATVTVTPKNDVGRYITEAEIDAAWFSALDEDSFDWREAAERALQEFGIVRCKTCNGNRRTWEGDTEHVCVACKGHGWILNPERQPPASGDAKPEGDADAPE